MSFLVGGTDNVHQRTDQSSNRCCYEHTCFSCGKQCEMFNCIYNGFNETSSTVTIVFEEGTKQADKEPQKQRQVPGTIETIKAVQRPRKALKKAFNSRVPRAPKRHTNGRHR